MKKTKDDVLLGNVNMELSDYCSGADLEGFRWFNLPPSDVLQLNKDLVRHSTQSQKGVCFATQLYLSDKLLLFFYY